MKHLIVSLIAAGVLLGGQAWGGKNHRRSRVLHLEIGAANSIWKNEKAKKDTSVRFKVLEHSARDVVARFGRTGTIYLNDIDGKGLKLAARHLRGWLRNEGYTKIKVIELPGDLRLINFDQKTLPRKFKSISMHNPSREMIYGDTFAPPKGFPTFLGQLKRLTLKKAKAGIVISTHFLDTPSDFEWYFGKEFVATPLGDGPVYHSADGHQPRYPKLFNLSPRNSQRQ